MSRNNYGRFVFKDKVNEGNNSKAKGEIINNENLDEQNQNHNPPNLPDYGEDANDSNKIELTELSSDVNESTKNKINLKDEDPGININNEGNFGNPQYFDLIRMDSSKSNDIYSHPQPTTSEFHSSNKDDKNLYKNKKIFDNKSFDRKMDGRKIQMNDIDLKSLTQPLTLVDFVHHDDVLGNHITSPNSHQINQNFKNTSFIENKGMKNRFKIVNSDDLHLTENKQSTSDPLANHQTDQRNIENSNSLDQSTGSRGNEREHNISPSEDEVFQKEPLPLKFKNKINDEFLKPVNLEKMQSHEDNRFNKSVYESRFKIREDFESINANKNKNSARVYPVNLEDHIFKNQKETVKEPKFLSIDDKNDSPISPVIPYFKYQNKTEKKDDQILKVNEINANIMRNNDYNEVEKRSSPAKNTDIDQNSKNNNSKKNYNKAVTHTYQSNLNF